MNKLNYGPLLTDLYQFTMAYGYWRLNMHEREACFHLLFRKNPFKSNYALCCGLQTIVDFLEEWQFAESDLDYLGTLKNSHQDPLFEPAFLDYLRSLRFSCDLDAISEGTIIFPHTPLLRLQGPLLNMINFQTLVATKASRVCRAAGEDEVIEFGMRRAQGPDGALSASRASYIGGCVATSNTLAGKLFDIPVRGTHAHSWVSAFESEQEAFNAYAEVMPYNGVLLVDTYNTLQGVEHSIIAGRKLREVGADLLAIRLDSGDMAAISIEARRMLDEAGFQQTKILASNSLDEYMIQTFKANGAAINAWGVGTNLTTAYDHPALDGVYKLSALQDETGKWQYKLKLSEQEVKVSNPGRHQVRRFFVNEHYVTDVIYDLDLGISEAPETVLFDPSLQNVRLDDTDAFVDLLVPVFKRGKLVQRRKSIHLLRDRAMTEAHAFYAAHGEKAYPVSLEKNLYNVKRKLIAKFRP